MKTNAKKSAAHIRTVARAITDAVLSQPARAKAQVSMFSIGARFRQHKRQ